MPVDVRSHTDLAWEASLEPEGEGNFEKEPFQSWWARNNGRLANLHPLIAEQWVYRHWTHSPFRHLPLERLSWRLERWPVERILKDVAWGWSDSDDHPDFNFETFHGKHFEPGKTMDATGTWNLPPVILEASGGLLTDHGLRPEAHHWLIEGHQRRRYLHALACRGKGAGRPGAMHEVFLLSLRESPSIS